MEGDIIVTKPYKAKRNQIVAFKNNAPFINCIPKINGVKIDNADYLRVVMLMYNLLECSKNYRKTTGSIWNYYRDEPSNHLSSNSESCKYRTSIKGHTGYDGDKVGKNKNEVIILLIYLSNFWRALNIPLINCEAELILIWSKNCVLADMAVANNPSTGLDFKIIDTKLHVPVVTLSKENDITLLD